MSIPHSINLGEAVVTSRAWLDVQNYRAVSQLADAFRCARRARGLTRSQLAREMNVSTQMVRDIERGSLAYWKPLVDYASSVEGVLQMDFDLADEL